MLGTLGWLAQVAVYWPLYQIPRLRPWLDRRFPGV